MLRVRIVDGDHRELQHAVLGHGLEADHARRRLLGGAEHPGHELLAVVGREPLHPAAHRRRQIVEAVQGDHVQGAHEVRAVVHCDVGPVRERRADVVVVTVVVFALDGEDFEAVILDEVGGDVVLRGQGVRRAQGHVGAPHLQGHREVRRFRRHVQARREPAAGERPLRGEALADLAQHRHRPLGPFGAPASRRRQAEVLDVVLGGARGGGHAFACWVR